MKHLRRFLVFQSLLAWQGGFFLYATFVIPIGTEVLESAAQQGAITQRVSNWLNVLGVLALVLLAVDQIAVRPLRKSRWVVWFMAALCHIYQLVLHPCLDSQFDPATLAIKDRQRFYFWHETYLTAAGIQWFACLIAIWLLLVAWHRESRGTP